MAGPAHAAAIPPHFVAIPRPNIWRREAAAFRDLPVGRCIQYAVLWQIASFVILSMQMVLVCALGGGALLLGVAGVVLLFAYMPLAGATVFLQILLYQNWFLSVFGRMGIDPASFTAVQGFAFALVLGMACVAVVRIFAYDDRAGTPIRLTRWVCAALIVVILYTAYGALKASPTSSIANFRNTSAMLLALLVGLDLGRAWGYRTLGLIFLVSIPFGAFLAISELLFPHAYYAAVGTVEFANLKYSWPNGTEMLVRSVDDLIRGRAVTWFNITGGWGTALSVRIGGPNMHPISYAYVIAVTGIVAATLRRIEVVALTVAFLVLAGIKGALLMLVGTIGFFLLWWITRQRTFVSIVSLIILVAYVGLGIRVGLSNGDYHVLGLLGGVNGVLTMPQGHGIGVGGNLSVQGFEGLDWASWQKLGVDFALESAVGVLLYQMGVAAAAVYMPIIYLMLRGPRRGGGRTQIGLRGVAAASMTDALFIGIAVTLANGFFQEEAYSPYALGLLTLLGGVVVGNSGAVARARTA